MPRMNKIGKTATSVTRTPDGTVQVKYHDTVIIKVDKRGRVTLDHGGWKTYTTKTRMNQAASELNLDFSVYQDSGRWYVWLRKRDIKLDFEATPLSFKL